MDETATTEKKFAGAADPVIRENLDCRSGDGDVVATVVRAVSSSTFEIGRSSATMQEATADMRDQLKGLLGESYRSTLIGKIVKHD